MTLLIFALSFLHRRLCIEKSSRFRRLSLMPSRFVEKFATFGNVSLLVCTALGMKEDVLGINYQASSNVCELIRGTNGCIEYDSGDITGWQAFRRCDGEATGTILILFNILNIKQFYVISIQNYLSQGTGNSPVYGGNKEYLLTSIYSTSMYTLKKGYKESTFQTHILPGDTRVGQKVLSYVL